VTEVERVRGSASAFHARSLPEDGQRHLWWFEVDRPAIVLGSTQSDALLDAAACGRRGVEVVRRRSGGGAVLLVPDEVVWLDVVIVRGDPCWDDDVGRAMWWIGEAWAGALGDLGVAGDDGEPPQVHRGGLVATAWSRHVCFAGLGPGEVTLAGRKLVGVSQRRTRGAARFQCAVYRRWSPDLMLDLLAAPRPTADELGVVATVDHPVERIVDAVTARFTARG